MGWRASLSPNQLVHDLFGLPLRRWPVPSLSTCPFLGLGQAATDLSCSLAQSGLENLRPTQDRVRPQCPSPLQRHAREISVGTDPGPAELFCFSIPVALRAEATELGGRWLNVVRKKKKSIATGRGATVPKANPERADHQSRKLCNAASSEQGTESARERYISTIVANIGNKRAANSWFLFYSPS